MQRTGSNTSDKSRTINRRSALKTIGATGAGVVGIGSLFTTRGSGKPISPPGGSGDKEMMLTDTNDYILDSSTSISFTSRIEHLLTAHADDGTYNHKFSLNSQGVAVADSGGKNDQITNHIATIDGRATNDTIVFYMSSDQEALAGYPDAGHSDDATTLFKTSIKAVAGALNSVAGLAVSGVDIYRAFANYATSVDDNPDYWQSGWAYQGLSSVADAAHQVKIFASHPDNDVPYFDVKTNISNSVMHDFNVTLGRDSAINAFSLGEQSGSSSQVEKQPVPSPQAMSKQEKQRYGVRKIPPEKAPTKPGTDSVKMTHVLTNFPLKITHQPSQLKKQEAIEREKQFVN